MLKLLFHILIGSILAATSASAMQIVYNIEALDQSRGLGMFLTTYHDASAKMSFDDIKALPDKAFQRPMQVAPSYGFVEGSIWVRLNLANKDSQPKDLVLRYGYSFVDKISLYSQNAEGVWHSETKGDTNVNYDSALFNRLPTFSISLAPGLNQYFIKITTKGTNVVPLTLLDHESYRRAEIKEYVIIAATFGIFSAMISYNVFLFLTLRSRLYLVYSLYMTAFCLYVLAISGIFNLFAWLNVGNNWLSNEGTVYLASLAAILMTIFTEMFLNVKSYLPKIHKVFLFFYCLVTFDLVIVTIYDYGVGTIITSLSITFMMIFVLLTAIYSSFRRYRPAYYFSIAFFVLILANISASLKFGGLIPHNDLTNWSQQIGGSLEAILLSLALGGRYNFERRKAHKKMVQLNSQMQHSYSQLSKIVYPHQIEQIKSGGNLENTMPIERSSAYVICFDVIGSSKVHHPQFQKFLTELFAICYEKLDQDYNADRLESQGFRIKEMGDGFLCSLGYPFKFPRSLTASDALRLAREFIQEFYRHKARVLSEVALHCSVSVVYGSLQGMYPASGAKQYDLHGRALVLATRYESIRKDLEEFNDGCSIIVIQETVFRRLQAHEQEALKRIPLSSDGLFVRDDPAARDVYVNFLTENDSATLAS